MYLLWGNSSKAQGKSLLVGNQQKSPRRLLAVLLFGNSNKAEGTSMKGGRQHQSPRRILAVLLFGNSNKTQDNWRAISNRAPGESLLLLAVGRQQAKPKASCWASSKIAHHESLLLAAAGHKQAKPKAKQMLLGNSNKAQIMFFVGRGKYVRPF